jgi:hypothetical protein
MFATKLLTTGAANHVYGTCLSATPLLIVYLKPKILQILRCMHEDHFILLEAQEGSITKLSGKTNQILSEANSGVPLLQEVFDIVAQNV